MRAKAADKIPMIVADWKTGAFTQRELAEKHKVSNGYVAQKVKGIAQDNEALISAGVQYKQGLAQLNEQEMSSVSSIVDERTKHIQFFTHAAVKNVADAMAETCEGQQDYQRRADTILKGREAVLGKTPDTAIQINNNQSEQPRTLDTFYGRPTNT